MNRLSRREFIQGGALLGAATRLRAAKAPRPNIILVQADSWDGRVLGCLGHPAMKRATPNIDRIAREGAAFRNAYCAHPICCPSRANLWSGRYTHHVESWNNYKGLSPGDPTFKTCLEQAGYRFATPQGGFGKHDYLSGGHTVFNRVVDWTGPANIRLPQFRMSAPKILEAGQEAHAGDWAAVNRAKAFLREAAREAANGDRPFFLYVGLNLPHPAFTISREWLEKVDRDAVTIPPQDDEVHPVMDYQRISKGWDHGFSEDMVRTVRTVYYAMCAETDAMVGALKDEMDRTGLDADTYFIFTSDHGENAMEHRQYYKMNMYESSVRVPLVTSGPGVRRGRIIDNIVSLIDVFPTLMDMAGRPHPPDVDGESLMPLLRGQTTRSRNWAHAMYSGSSSNTTMFMLRHGEWKYVEYPGYLPQLFNVREGPDEVKNLARKRPDAAKDMAARLRRVVDCDQVHRKVIAYDKASFGAFREELKRKPMPLREPGIDNPAATYDDVMAHCYRGWKPEHDRQIQQWLDSE